MRIPTNLLSKRPNNVVQPGRRKLTVAGLMIAAAGGLFASNAQAQGYPTKVITIVVPYTAGGASDVLTRVIAQKLSQAWGQPVIVENKPGASGAIGTNFVAKAAPDGYTFLVSDLGTMTIMPSLKKLPYALEKDLAPVSILSYSPYLLTVNPKLPVNSERIDRLFEEKPGQAELCIERHGHQSAYGRDAVCGAHGTEMDVHPEQGRRPVDHRSYRRQ